jgi:predicted double-glycine peptidase
MINCSNIWLKRGSTGIQVVEAQKRLKANGFYLNYSDDGIFGPKMGEATVGFQRKFKLDDDEIIGPKTCKVLNENPQCPDNNLKWGCVGKNVETLQNYMNVNKFGSLKVDGEFMDATKAAVMTMQKAIGAYIDGIVGNETRTKMAKPISTTGVVELKITEIDRQDTDHTCGPSTLRTIFLYYGLNILESLLATWAKTTSTNGTTVENMVKTVSIVNSQYKKAFKSHSEGFETWTKIRNYIAKGTPIALRIQSFIRPNGGEHYVTLYAIDIETGYALLADPSYGKRSIKLTELRERIRKVSSNSIIPVSI